jgi:hypothetical protein
MSSITLEDFLENFTVRVVEYKTNSNTSIDVHFEIQCTLNGRLSIHIASIDITSLEQYTTNDILNLAWDSVKQNIIDWATTNVVKVPFSTFTPQTTTNDISLADLNNNFSIRVSRWELYPRERPSVWCVGFEMIKNGGNQSKALDCTFPFTTLCNNTLCLDIMTTAWDTMKGSFCAWASEVLADADVVNTNYIPTNLTI